jgi:hypothetical protein
MLAGAWWLVLVSARTAPQQMMEPLELEPLLRYLTQYIIHTTANCLLEETRVSIQHITFYTAIALISRRVIA